ncbi:MAG: hypothetical protein LBN43_08070, partial [Oscillospiraceae bacterium]|nr:hypothetical protein [Oscillospiraceae bacterium]
ESGSDEDTTKRLGPIVEQAKAEVEKLEAQDAEQSVEEAEDYFPENDAQITPEDVHYRYAARADNLRARTLAAVTVSLVMIYITLAVSFGWSLPSVFFDSSITLTGALAIGQLIITVLGIDVVITGIYDVLKFKPGAESLVVLSGMAAFADAANTMLLGETLYGMPYSLTASVALIFAMYGTRLGKSAYNKMLKTIAPFGKETLAIYAEWEKVDNGLVLSKSVGSTEGFLFKATRSDCSEILFGKIGPLLMLAAPVLAGISAIGTGRTEAFLRIWAAITCGAAAFSPLLAFNLPFNLASKRLSSTNTALAAWEGAEDISGTVGLIIKDNDLFKTSALRLSSFKVAQNFSVEQVVLYTASMIIHSGSGLTKIFSELLEEYGLAPAGISGFVTHEAGGLSAVIGGDKVYFGSEAFMRLKNIVLDEVPTKIGGAVFLSINGVAAGVFIVQYAPSEKVQKALLRMSKYKISPLLATRDVNITPTMLRSKFKLDLQNLEFPPYDERYALSDDSMETKAKPSALMSQDSLSAFADIAEAGKWLYNRAKFGTNMSALSSVIGAFAMFFLCHSGAFVAASPVKALLFHFILTVVVMFRSSL